MLPKCTPKRILLTKMTGLVFYEQAKACSTKERRLKGGAGKIACHKAA
jgi:hypothetical protein